jgi:hypothetical protein
VADETEKERVDRELIELLNELRVALPGVQVVFAFLLTIPFSKGWATTTRFEHDLYLVSLIAAVLATVLLMGPTAYHRLLFRHNVKERILVHGNRLALAGLASLAVCLMTSTFLVTHYLFGSLAAGLVAACSSAIVLVVWLGLPLWIRLRR